MEKIKIEIKTRIIMLLVSAVISGTGYLLPKLIHLNEECLFQIEGITFSFFIAGVIINGFALLIAILYKY
jgi:hypothetical protein